MYEYKCKIDRVIDGDTVDVDIDLGFEVVLKSQRIRLDNIDAPESRTSDDEEKKYGMLAKSFVEEFFSKGEALLVTKEYNPKGKYGRIIGDFYIDGVSLCNSLLENHHAVIYNGQSREELKDDHLINREILEEK
jgi:micrococcal nuclease